MISSISDIIDVYGRKFSVTGERDLNKGKIYSIFGCNGIGKTTFLNQLASLGSSNDKIALIPQKIEDLLLPWLCESTMIKIFNKNFLTHNKNIHNQRVKLPFGNRSGGEKQDFAINLLTSFKFDIALLDEPFSSLDMQKVKQNATLLKTYVNSSDCQVFVILHDYLTLQYLSDYIIFFNHMNNTIQVKNNLFKITKKEFDDNKISPELIQFCEHHTTHIIQ